MSLPIFAMNELKLSEMLRLLVVFVLLIVKYSGKATLYVSICVAVLNNFQFFFISYLADSRSVLYNLQYCL